MHNEYTFLGDFKGKFFTLQAVALSSGEAFPIGNEHAVRVYAGDLKNAEYESDYQPEQYRKLCSFLLVNVPKITIYPKGNAPFSDARVYNFTQLLLIDPKVVRTFEIKGKTYGEIESKAYGKTEKYPLVDKLSPDPVPPALVDESHTVSEADFYSQDEGSSFSSYFRGCLDNIWKILLFLFLAWLLFSLLRSCNNGTDYCSLKEKAQYKLELEKKLLDTVKDAYEKNLPLAMSGISKVYFFNNSTDFETSALGNISRLHNVLKHYPDKTFIIEGHHSGKDLESTEQLDLKRAEKMKDTLVSMGISSKRLTVVAMGDQNLIDKTRIMSTTYLPDGTQRAYNQNMRIEVKWKEANE